MHDQGEPWSARVTDLFVLAFGAWTILVNGVVLGEGGLARLIGLLPWVGGAFVLLLVWWFRPGLDPVPGAPTEDRPRDISGRSRLALALLVAGALVVLCLTQNVLLGWWVIVGSLLVVWIWVMPRTGGVDCHPQSDARSKQDCGSWH